LFNAKLQSNLIQNLFIFSQANFNIILGVFVNVIAAAYVKNWIKHIFPCKKRSVMDTFHSSNETPMILITGIPKTGSTVLFYSLLGSLPSDTISIFEPRRGFTNAPKESPVPVLVKCFMDAATEYDHFNRKVLISRDPRDQIISQMLYRPFNIVIKKMIQPDYDLNGVIDRLLTLLQQKENDSRSVSVREIRECVIPKGTIFPQEKQMEYYAGHRDVFVLKYEDLIMRNFDRLNDYLGFQVKPAEIVPIKRVIRTKSFGNWKDWFTPEDVEYYRPHLCAFMKLFGYEDDWELNINPMIDPAYSSQYVYGLLSEAGFSIKDKP